MTKPELSNSGDDVLNTEAQDYLKAFLERANNLEDAKDEAAADLTALFAEGKGKGFDPKVMRKVVKIARMDRAKYLAEMEMIDLYLSAAGLL